MAKTSFKDHNAAYERWLHDQCDVVEKDLRRKHKRMKKNPFTFLRATFFRWARRIEAVCPELANAPAVLSVGDLHLENYGTWRDADGRLVWGVNDFDEAAVIPYAYDLVRLVTSIRLAPKLPFANRAAADAILRGYRDGLREPRATLLDEQETWMRDYVACTDKERRAFWSDVCGWPKTQPPKEAADGLELYLPKGAKIERFATRVAGGGGLGRPRYIALADWAGGRVVREAKAIVPSAWGWAHGSVAETLRFGELAKGEFRSPDPYLKIKHGYVFRRIAADSRKVEIERLNDHRLTAKLLVAMGFDLGATHAADRSKVDAIRADLRKRSGAWLHDAARAAEADVRADYREWTR